MALALLDVRVRLEQTALAVALALGLASRNGYFLLLICLLETTLLMLALGVWVGLLSRQIARTETTEQPGDSAKLLGLMAGVI